MVWTILQSQTVIPASSGTPSSMTATLSSITGNDVMIIACVTARSALSSFSSQSAEWDGTPMTLAVFEDPALEGFGEGFSGIYYLAVGDLVAETANVVHIPSPNIANHGRAMTVYAVSGILQISSVHAIDSADFVSGASGVTRSVTKSATDFAVGNLTLSSQLTPTGSGTMVFDGNANNSAIAGDAITHASVHIVPSEPSGSMAWTFNGSSAFAVTSASFFEAVAPGAAVISDVNGGSTALPEELDLTVNGTDLFTAGTTQLWVADSTMFATADKVLQTISSVTTTSLNWDFIDLGTVGEGEVFLFIVTDEGQPGELISSAFLMNILSRDVHQTSRIYTTTGSTGVINVVTDVAFDNPVAAVIRATANTSVDTLQSDSSVSCLCFVSGNDSMGMCSGAQVTPFESYQRARSDGSGSLIIMAGGDGGEADLVVGTPVMTATGLDINFTTNTAGLTLYITIFGGLSAQSALKSVSTADGSVSGFGFEADAVVGMSNGLGSGSFGDSTFALTSFGVAKNPGGGADQWVMASNHEDATKNCALIPGEFCGQLTGTGFTWLLDITSFTSDGVTWAGTNSDYMHILALSLPGMGIAVGEFTKESTGVDNLSEPLPDLGFEPGLLFLTTTHRITSGPAGVVGVRWSSGGAERDAQGCMSIRQLPESSPTTCEQKLVTTDIVDCSSGAGVSTLVGNITDLAQISTIQWTTNPASAVKFCYLSLEATEELDFGGDSIVEEID